MRAVLTLTGLPQRLTRRATAISRSLSPGFTVHVTGLLPRNECPFISGSEDRTRDLSIGHLSRNHVERYRDRPKSARPKAYYLSRFTGPHIVAIVISNSTRHRGCGAAACRGVLGLWPPCLATSAHCAWCKAGRQAWAMQQGRVGQVGTVHPPPRRRGGGHLLSVTGIGPKAPARRRIT